MRSGFSSPPSGRRMSSAAGAPFFTWSASASSVCTAQGIMPSVACSSPRACLDALADLLFVLGLEQLPLADVLEIDADQIEVFPRRVRPRRALPLRLRFDLGRPALSAADHRLRRPRVLVLEGFRIVFGDELARRQDDCLIRFLAGTDAEFVGALTPVEHVGVTIGLRPVDQRVGVAARAAAPARRSVAGWGDGRLFARHTAGYCKSAALERDMLARQ